MRQALLSFHGPGERIMGGVGAFGAYEGTDDQGNAIALKHEPVLVSESVASQYDTEEMREQGWVVEWQDVAPASSLSFFAPETAPPLSPANNSEEEG